MTAGSAVHYCGCWRMSDDTGNSKPTSSSSSGNVVASAPSAMTGFDDSQTDGKYPSCSNLFDRMWHCGNPSGQLSNAWKHGDIENCAPW